MGNLRLAISKLGARTHWGFWRGQEIEGWGAGIRLLDEWGFFDRPEPRLARRKCFRQRDIALAAR